MSLNFTASSSRVTVSDTASMRPAEFTAVVWWYQSDNTSSTQQYLWSKLTQVRASTRTLFEARVDCTTTNANFWTTSVAIIGWNYGAWTFDSSLNLKGYYGDLNTVVREMTYGAAPTQGAGSPTSTSGTDWQWGNNDIVSNAIADDLGYCQLYDRVLTLGEMQHLQFKMPMQFEGCVCNLAPGLDGNGTQIDYSGNGNDGTVTSGNQSPNPPIGAGWGGDIGLPYAVAAAGGTILPFMMHY